MDMMQDLILDHIQYSQTVINCLPVLILKSIQKIH